MSKKILLLLCSLSTIVLASYRHQELELTKKLQELDLAKKLPVGIWSDIGKKPSQEDRYHIGEKLFMVCDGHAGFLAAESGVMDFPSLLAKHWKVAETKKEAFDNAIKDLEDKMGENAKQMKSAGSTLVAAYVGKKKIHIIWAGDSRALYWGSKKEIIATQDHTCASGSEKKRVLEAKGIIYREVLRKGGQEQKGPWRVNGTVPTRTIGGFPAKDLHVKQLIPHRSCLGLTLERLSLVEGSSEAVITPSDFFKEYPQKGQIIADPDYIHIERSDENHFLVIASDGLWDALSNEEVLKFVEEFDKRGMSTQEIAKELVKAVLGANREGQDNITVIVLDLRQKNQQ